MWLRKASSRAAVVTKSHLAGQTAAYSELYSSSGRETEWIVWAVAIVVPSPITDHLTRHVGGV